MDYRNTHESWECQGEDYNLQKDSDLDMSKFVWNGITQDDEDISYMIEGKTPVKACDYFPCHFDDCEKDLQVKRRRTLDFDNASEDTSSLFLKSKEKIDFIDEVLPEVAQLEVLFQDMSPSDFDDHGQSEAWLADCLIDCSNDGNASSSVHIGSKEVCEIAPDSGENMVQRTVRSSRRVIFKGKKSYMRTPTKLASSVAYPFDFIKPCGVRGDVTLKDINQRILDPFRSKSNEVKDNPPVCYPTSAFSGKPVVGKTKIPTQGGKGSITIMRTKG